MSIEALLDAAAKLSHAPVLVVGDVIADRYHFGLPTRISREAPVLILEHVGETTIPGGAANAAANVVALGGDVVLVGVVGDDTEAEMLRVQVTALGIDPGGMIVEAGRVTTSKTRVFAGPQRRGQQVVRLDRATRSAVEGGTRAALLETGLAALARSRALLISDYGYGACDPGLIGALVDAATQSRLPVLVDTQGDLRAYRGASVVTPNLAELEAWAGERLVDAAAVAGAAGRLRAEIGAEAVLCTRGGDGMTLVTGGEPVHLPVARRADVADVAGAGDTVAATIAMGLAAGIPLRVACLLADCAASVVVQKPGAATCSPDELRDAIREIAVETLAAGGL